MRLPYSLIFRSGGGGEDGEESACGLTRAYMRFLYSLLDFPHTFWDDDVRVGLSDVERQIIERGTAVLSSLECDCPMPELVLTAALSSDVAYPTAVHSHLKFTASVELTDYVDWKEDDGELVFLLAGLYQVVVVTRVHGLITPAGAYNQLVGVRLNGVSRAWVQNLRQPVDATCNPVAIIPATAGQILSVTYWHNLGSNATLRSGDTRIWVVRLA